MKKKKSDLRKLDKGMERKNSQIMLMWRMRENKKQIQKYKMRMYKRAQNKKKYMYSEFSKWKWEKNGWVLRCNRFELRNFNSL